MSLLSPAAKCPYAGFSSLLKYVIPEALPPLLMDTALARGECILEPLALALLDTGEASSSFSQKSPL